MLIEPPIPILVLPFRGGELHCCGLDGYKQYTDAFLARLALVEAHFTAMPHSRQCRVWYNLDESALPQELITAVAQSLARIQPHILKLSFIGVGFAKRRQLQKALSAAMQNAVFPYRHFADAEKAKEWLV